MTRNERDIRALVERCGCEILDTRQGKHLVVRLRHIESGIELSVPFSVSPSDRRAALNQEKQLRRQIEQLKAAKEKSK